MSAGTEMEMLVRLCAGLGATPDQARTMASQMLKRVDQIVTERGGTREEAMRYLLEVVTKGRAGSVAPSYDKARPPVSPGTGEA